MPIVTLLTDWGTSDHYVASVKGAILSSIVDAKIIDISHHIRLFDIRHAAFVMRNAWIHFPVGTIHILGIDSIESEKHPHLVVQSGGHYFIGADNGLISIILDQAPEKIVILSVHHDSGHFTFPSLNRFAKVASLLCLGTPIEQLGEVTHKLNIKTLLQPNFDGKIIYGKIMHIDHYENVFVNITETFIGKCFGRLPFTVTYRDEEIMFVRAYADVHEGSSCALFASNGYLEIAVNRGKAASLMGLAIDKEVKISLKE